VTPSQVPEQQSASKVQKEPVGLQHVNELHTPPQQSVFVSHPARAGRQAQLAHRPDEHVPEQHSRPVEHRLPGDLQPHDLGVPKHAPPPQQSLSDEHGATSGPQLIWPHVPVHWTAQQSAASAEMSTQHDLAVVCACRLEASGQSLFGVQAFPAGQQRRLVPLPQGVLPAGHPQSESARLAHATPALQHDLPHGPVPAGQQHPALLHASPRLQHALPHATSPLAQVAASARNGFRIVALKPAAPAAASALRTARRECAAAA